MMNKLLSLLTITSIFALSACGQKGSEYEGKWQLIGHTNTTMLIEADGGDTFVITASMPNPLTGDPITSKVPAKVENNYLISNNKKYLYDKNTDHLIYGSYQFERVK